jgi:hypothetical protein
MCPDLKPITIFGVCGCILLYAGISHAEDYEPIKTGGFLLTPKLVLEQRYDDNIYADDDHEESDFVTAAKPSLIITKLYRDHEFNLSGQAEAVKFWDHSNEDMLNAKGEFSGRLTARRVLTLPFKFSYAVDHKDRLYDRGIQARDPTQMDTLRSEIGAEYKPNRLMLGFYTGYNQYRYENGARFSGVPIIHEDGDYDSLYFKGVAKYLTRTDITPFMSLMVAKNDYLRQSYDGSGFNGLKRDNRVLRALAGVEFEYHDILKGSAAVGHDWRSYDENSIDDIGAFSAEGNIEWAPFRKTKLTLEFLRQSEEDNIVNDGSVQTSASLGINYELQHDWFLESKAEWEKTAFEAIDRDDDLYGGSIGLNYVLNSKLEMGGSYLHRWRESTQNDSDFDENVFMLRLTGKL